MQHLDEGTIHSWLDGALSTDEAARVKAHVAECPQCAAAVAEARGFIAASSRILTALDNAPRRVLPVAAPRKRVDPLVWRMAATILVVAAGTLAVVQNRGSNERLKAVSENQTSTSPQPATVTEQDGAEQMATAGAADAVSPDATVGKAQTTRAPATTALTSKAPTSKAPTVASAGKAATRNARRGITTGDNRALAEQISVPTRETAIASDFSRAPTPPTLTGARSGVAGGAMDAATEPARLKVVSSPRQIGAKVTLYEVAPGDTVTLTESIPIALNSIVLRGNATVQMAPQAVAKSAAAPAAPAPSRTEMASTLHTITWTDSATGNTLTLSGRMPEARLQEIRIRIERERAAAKAKMNP